MTYTVDRNHTGFRLGQLGVLIGVFLLVAFVATPFVANLIGADLSGLCLVEGVVGLIFGILAMWGSESLLYRLIPSGRSLALEKDSLILSNRDGSQVQIDLSKRVDVFAWQFTIDSRRVWVQKGWACCSLRIMQGKNFITPYAFLGTEHIQQIPEELQKAFAPLISNKAAQQPGNEHLRDLMTEQTHLRAAEDDRWLEGAELQAEEFIALVKMLADRLPDWPQPNLV